MKKDKLQIIFNCASITELLFALAYAIYAAVEVSKMARKECLPSEVFVILSLTAAIVSLLYAAFFVFVLFVLRKRNKN